MPGLRWLPLALIAVALLAAGCGGDDDDASGEAVACPPGTPGCELRQSVHWHADFEVVLNGQPWDFSQQRYLSGDDSDGHLSDNVHIHAPRYNIIHVHTEQTTWNEFLGTLGWSITDECLTTDDGAEYCSGHGGALRFIVNGVLIDSIRFHNISDLDRVLILYGNETDEEALAMWQTVGDEACIVSELCEDRIPPGGIEEEPCTGAGACT